MDEIYQQAIDRLAHECSRAIFVALYELGLFSEREKQEYLQAVDAFFAKKSYSGAALENQQNGIYHTVNGHINSKVT